MSNPRVVRFDPFKYVAYFKSIIFLVPVIIGHGLLKENSVQELNVAVRGAVCRLILNRMGLDLS
jgi:hypothetical protein